MVAQIYTSKKAFVKGEIINNSTSKKELTAKLAFVFSKILFTFDRTYFSKKTIKKVSSPINISSPVILENTGIGTLLVEREREQAFSTSLNFKELYSYF